MPTAARADAASLMQDRQKLLHKEKWRVDISSEQLIEILDRGVLDCRGLRDPGVGDKNVQAITHDRANLLREPVRPVRCSV